MIKKYIYTGHKIYNYSFRAQIYPFRKDFVPSSDLNINNTIYFFNIYIIKLLNIVISIKITDIGVNKIIT